MAWGRFVCGNLHQIARIIPTGDVHELLSIEHAYRLSDAEGNCPPAFTVVTSEDLRTGRWFVRPEYGETMRRHYAEVVAGLEIRRGYGLVIWPYHCIEETGGALMMPFAKSCCEWWGAVRGEGKYVEHFRKENHRDFTFHSVFRSDMPDTIALGSAGEMDRRAKALRQTLIGDLVGKGRYVAFLGEAASHCLGWSVDDFVDEELIEILTKANVPMSHLVVLTDCTAPIVVRDARGEIIPGPTTDYRPATELMFDRWRNLGMTLVDSTVPVDEWAA